MNKKLLALVVIALLALGATTAYAYDPNDPLPNIAPTQPPVTETQK